MKILKIFLIGLALSMLAGCSSQERGAAAFYRLKNGMTESELTDLLGTPKKTENNSDFVIWTYPVGMVFLKDGKVYSWRAAELKP